MDVIIDFHSEEAIYIQLCNQIIIGIATNQYREGDMLPSVRQMAEDIGINMHTVNKAYATLKREGFVKLDRRKGAMIKVDADKLRVLRNMRKEFEEIYRNLIVFLYEKDLVRKLLRICLERMLRF